MREQIESGRGADSIAPVDFGVFPADGFASRLTATQLWTNGK
jgi:hypothetical protein